MLPFICIFEHHPCHWVLWYMILPPLACASYACKHPHTSRAVLKIHAICFGKRTKLFWRAKQNAFFFAYISTSNYLNELKEKGLKHYLSKKKKKSRKKILSSAVLYNPLVETQPLSSTCMIVMTPIHLYSSSWSVKCCICLYLLWNKICKS